LPTRRGYNPFKSLDVDELFYAHYLPAFKLEDENVFIVVRVSFLGDAIPRPLFF
jgi:hypothetical protein